MRAYLFIYLFASLAMLSYQTQVQQALTGPPSGQMVALCQDLNPPFCCVALGNSGSLSVPRPHGWMGVPPCLPWWETNECSLTLQEACEIENKNKEHDSVTHTARRVKNIGGQV